MVDAAISGLGIAQIFDRVAEPTSPPESCGACCRRRMSMGLPSMR